MDDKTILELDPYNLRATAMPLVDLLNAGPISWADRRAITDAIRETLRTHKSLMAEHRHHNEASEPAAAEIGKAMGRG